MTNRAALSGTRVVDGVTLVKHGAGLYSVNGWWAEANEGGAGWYVQKDTEPTDTAVLVGSLKSAVRWLRASGIVGRA